MFTIGIVTEGAILADIEDRDNYDYTTDFEFFAHHLLLALGPVNAASIHFLNMDSQRGTFDIHVEDEHLEKECEHTLWSPPAIGLDTSVTYGWEPPPDNWRDLEKVQGAEAFKLRCMPTEAEYQRARLQQKRRERR